MTGGRKRRRKRRRKSLRKKNKSRKRNNKSKRRRRSRRRKQKGGACPYNKNLGEQYSLRPYNNLSGSTPRGGYVSTNNNRNVPTPYQKGGSLTQELGISDLMNSYYNLGNKIGGLWQNYSGKKGYDSANPMDQPAMNKPEDYRHKIPDFEEHHRGGVTEAAQKGTITK